MRLEITNVLAVNTVHDPLTIYHLKCEFVSLPTSKKISPLLTSHELAQARDNSPNFAFLIWILPFPYLKQYRDDDPRNERQLSKCEDEKKRKKVMGYYFLLVKDLSELFEVYMKWKKITRLNMAIHMEKFFCLPVYLVQGMFLW